MTTTASRPRVLLAAAGRGAVAGVLGGAAMSAAERVEQAVTGRPSSYVPGRTLRTLLGRPTPDRQRPSGWNLAMHWLTAAALGALRGSWAAVGLRGPRADVVATVVRLATDQTLENASGAGAPPHTWPLREQVIDVGHKALYAVVTGRVAEQLVPPSLESRRGTVSH